MTENLAQEAGAAGEARLDGGAQLAQYLAEQPRSRRTFDKVMKVLEMGALALMAGYLAWAIYVSINWSEPKNIVAVWFAFPVSVVVLLVLIGVHAAGLRAFPPLALLSSMQAFVSGSKAVATGVGFAVTVSLAAVFWGAFAWGIWTEDWAILEPLTQILGVVVGVGVIYTVASYLYKRFFRSR
jgi:hypothetical protein